MQPRNECVAQREMHLTPNVPRNAPPACGRSLLTRWLGAFRPCRCSKVLLVDLRHRLGSLDPAKRRTTPELCLGRQFSTLAHGANANTEHLGIGYICRVNWRTTIATERLHSFSPAFARFHIDLRLASDQLKAFLFRRNHNPKGGTRKRLAVGTVTYGHCSGINFRFISDTAAMATAVNPHDDLRYCLTLRLSRGRGAKRRGNCKRYACSRRLEARVRCACFHLHCVAPLFCDTPLPVQKDPCGRRPIRALAKIGLPQQSLHSPGPIRQAPQAPVHTLDDAGTGDTVRPHRSPATASASRADRTERPPSTATTASRIQAIHASHV